MLRLIADEPESRQPAASEGRSPAFPAAPLPSALTSLVGREQETAEIQALLRRPDVRLLTLTGPGGVGKTRLAIRAVDGLEADFPGGIAFVGLAAIRDPALVIPTIGHALGVADTASERPGHLPARRSRRRAGPADSRQSGAGHFGRPSLARCWPVVPA